MVTQIREATPDSEIDTSSSEIWQKVAVWGIGILFTGMPLAFGGLITYDMFDLPKVVFMRIMTLIILGAWGLKIINSGELHWRKTPLDLPVVAFGIASILSTIFTLSPNLSIHGEYRRYEGIYTIINYLVLYFLVTNLIDWPRRNTKVDKKTSSTFVSAAFGPGSNGESTAPAPWQRFSALMSRSIKRWDYFRVLLTTQIVAGSLVALYGILQHFGKDFVLYNPHGPSPVVSTFGNTNFLAAYLAMVIPIAISLFLSSRSLVAKLFTVACALVMTVGLFYSSSRGAWLGALVAVVFLLWTLGSYVLSRNRRWLVLMAILLVAPPLANYSFVVDRLQATFDTGQTSVQFRLQWWQSLVPVIRDNIVLGTGISTLEIAYPKYATLDYARGEGRETFLDKAHNEFVHIAVTQGMVGLGTYVWVLASFGLTFFEYRRRRRVAERRQIQSIPGGTSSLSGELNLTVESQTRHWSLLCGLMAGIVAYLVQNQFSFGVIGISSLFWMMMGMVVVMGSSHDREPAVTYRFNLSANLSFGLSVVLAGLIAVVLTFAFRPFTADQLYKDAMVLETEGKYDKAIAVYGDVLALNPYQTEYWRGLASTYVDKARTAMTVHNVAGDPEVEELLQNAVDAFKTATELNPAPFHYFFLGQTQQAFQTNRGLQEAYQNYRKAVALYPYYLYANRSLGDVAYQLRLFDDSARAYQIVALLDPEDVEAQYYLALDYVHLGKDDEQLAAWQRVAELDPNRFSAYYYAGTIYDKRGRPDLAKRNYDQFLRITPKPEDRAEYDRQKQQVQDALKQFK